MESDQDAIRRCCGGEWNAFGALVRRYERQAIAHALTILANREDALDAVQEAFLDAYKALKSFDPDKKFYPWLYVILRNRCYGLLRKRRRRADATDAEEVRATFLESRQPGGGEGIDLEQALSQLNSEDREILLLKYVDGLKYRELAERLEIAMGTVMSRLYHARGRLREKLEWD